MFFGGVWVVQVASKGLIDPCYRAETIICPGKRTSSSLTGFPMGCCERRPGQIGRIGLAPCPPVTIMDRNDTPQPSARFQPLASFIGGSEHSTLAIWAPTSRLGDHSHDSDSKYVQKCEIHPFLASEYAPTNVLRVVRTPIKMLPAVRDGTKAKQNGILSEKTLEFRCILPC